MIYLEKYRKHLIENEFFWRHVLNARSTREYQRYRLSADPRRARIVDDLDRTGMACTHIDEFPELAASYETLKQVALQVERARIEQSQNQRARRKRLADAPYAFDSNILGSFPPLDANSIFARFTTHLALLDVVNEYFGMFAQLRKYAVFRNVASTARQAVNSNWHRDGAFDTMIVRVFVYFSDIAAANGAMLYAPSTHKKCARGSRCIIPSEELDKMAVPICGNAGTIVFADTRAYHKAGPFSAGERWFYNSVFTSPGFGADYFKRTSRSTPRAQDPVSWALSSPMRFKENFVGSRSR